MTAQKKKTVPVKKTPHVRTASPAKTPAPKKPARVVAPKPPLSKTGTAKPVAKPVHAKAAPVVRAVPDVPVFKIPARLQAVIDRAEIADVIYAFSRGLDRLDENLLRGACHAEAYIDLGPGVFQGSVSDYIPWTLGVLQQAKATHHLVGNIRIENEGDTALVESYVQAHLRFDKPTGREDLFLGGRYLDRFERRPADASGVWKLIHRKQILDWTRTETVSEVFYHMNPDALWSARTKPDLSAQIRHFPRTAATARRFETKSIKF